MQAGAFDLVVVEALGCIGRSGLAYDFFAMCADNETRHIAIRDSIDTARDDWREKTCATQLPSGT